MNQKQFEQELQDQSQILVEAAFVLKDLLSKHKNAFKWETYLGDEKGPRVIDYRIKFHIEQVILDKTTMKVEKVVPPRLKPNLN